MNTFPIFGVTNDWSCLVMLRVVTLVTSVVNIEVTHALSALLCICTDNALWAC